jgi:NAD-dependent SIR2 family protein deacetylase
MFGEQAPNYKHLHHCHKKLKTSDIFMIIGTNCVVVNLTDIMNNPKYVS